MNIYLNYNKNFNINKFNIKFFSYYKKNIFSDKNQFAYSMCRRCYSISKLIKNFISLFVRYELDERANKINIITSSLHPEIFFDSKKFIKKFEKVLSSEKWDLNEMNACIFEIVKDDRLFVYHVVTTPLAEKTIFFILCSIPVILFVHSSGALYDDD